MNEKQKREKYNAYMRATGRSAMVSVTPSREHLNYLKDCGTTDAYIDSMTGIHSNHIQGIRRGRYQSILRTNEAKILAVLPAMSPTKGGSYRDATGTRRRLQGMIRDGFSGRYLATELGVKHQAVNHVAGKDSPPTVMATTAIKVMSLYDKLNGANPLDFGIKPAVVKRVITHAIRNGYAPTICWDWDTLDDPEAFPEWTGKCGTTAGREAHRYLNIMPICRACNDAVNAAQHERDALRLGKAH